VNGTSSEPSRERVIPIQILDEPMLPRLARGSSQEGAPPATTPLPSLFADLKLEATAARSSPFDHPRLAANFGRLGTAFGDDLLAFKSGIRESLFGMPNFGKFPSFGPILPGDSVNLSPINRRSGSAAGKKRLQKSKSSADKPSFGYVDYLNSESETDDDEEDLDSVSVVARTRDRLSGTGSTQSEDSSTHSGESHSNHSVESTHSDSTLSQDSGISEGGGGGGSHHGTNKPPRPISAVPSEISDVSILSSASSRGSESDSKKCDSSDEHQSFTANQRPLVVPVNSEEQETPPAGQPFLSPGGEPQDRAHQDRSYLIAKELLTTERHYVAKLHLIDQVFHFKIDQENRSSNLFSADTLTNIFSNVKSIYKFHAEFLLPQLAERMEKWHSSPEHQRIGDIMLRYSPFLIMYTEYVKNFDTAMRTINQLYSTNKKFAAIMDDIHGSDECENLTLQHHMLSPVQRIPRYELLLRDYLAKLPDQSPDRPDAENALKQVSQAASHANDSMKRIEQFKKLLEVQESIGGSIDLVSPTRELIKEGRIVKISARTGDHQDRYMFLLTDLLLLCSPRKSMISGSAYSVRARFQVENLQVLEGDNLVTANTFYLRDEAKSVELYTTTREEKEDWLQALFYAIKSLYTRKSSLRVGRDILRPLDCEIGKRRPHLQKLENASKCAECCTQFSIIKHKHNCRTCGAVFCGKCSDFKYALSWEDGRKGRVCRSCHTLLTSQTTQQPQQNNQQSCARPRGLLEVSAETPSAVHAGWLVLRPPGSKPATAKRYFVLRPDFVLYSFRTETDGAALTATPIPGFCVSTGAELKGDAHAPEKDRGRIIKLHHPSNKRLYYFAGISEPEVERWVEVLRLSARAELPPDYNPTAEPEKSTNSDPEKSANFVRKKSAGTVVGQPGAGRDTRSASSTEYENS